MSAAIVSLGLRERLDNPLRFPESVESPVFNPKLSQLVHIEDRLVQPNSVDFHTFTLRIRGGLP